MKKFAGITIMDTVITMILSSVILGMCGFFYLQLSQSITRANAIFEEVSEMQRFLFLIRSDLNHSVNIVSTEQEITMKNAKNEIESCYQISENRIIRKQMGIYHDTLKLKTNMYAYSCQYNPSMECIPNVFHWDLSTQKMNFQLNLFKKYTLSQQINTEFFGY